MIGKKRHRITFQEEVRTADGAGGFFSAWQNIAGEPTVWAEIEPVSATEALRFRQLQQTITHRIRIRFRSDVTAAMRIVKGARIFRIRAVFDPQERGQVLEILAEEGLFSD